MRNNPFGSTSRSRSAQVSVQDTEEHKREQVELNTALETLARVFPDVRIEVFRELLVRFDGDSRLQVCVDQLLRHKEKWVSGRWNISSGQGKGEEGDAEDFGDRRQAGSDPDGEECLVPLEERFRSDEYKTMVRATLGKEYSSLSKSVIEAVLAEVNFSYARARPTLRDLSRRTWRATFNSMLPSFRKKKDREEHLLVVWQRDVDGESLPRLKETGCAELDAELYDALVAPVLQQRREEQELGDFRFAASLNEKQARAADALYECECCFGDVTFEEIATCSADAHVICYHCIQRTTHEALFGQGWGKSVDSEHSTLNCLAPLSIGSCDGCLHPRAVQQAILQETAGIETLRKFEDRLASEALLKSQLKLVRCPFCSYAEADPIYHSVREIDWRIRRDGETIPTILMILFILDLVPILIIPFFVLLILDPTALTAIFDTAIRQLCLKVRPKKFTCANPTCQRISCMTCQKSWRDPHVCHEPLLTDLRATVEAARTAAVKRTCPRCGLSFVKSSGCNKLTCVCGYSMCYLCRKALGPPLQPARRNPRLRDLDIYDGPADDLENPMMNDVSDDEFEEPQGYKHFCEHFRINPGSRCTECSKCDLYQAEDEEAVARRAGEKAEREWHLRHDDANSSGESTIGLRNVNHDLSAGAERPLARRVSNAMWDLNFPAPGKPWTYWLADVWVDGQWKREGQALVNWIVERILVIENG